MVRPVKTKTVVGVTRVIRGNGVERKKQLSSFSEVLRDQHYFNYNQKVFEIEMHLKTYVLQRSKAEAFISQFPIFSLFFVFRLVSTTNYSKVLSQTFVYRFFTVLVLFSFVVTRGPFKVARSYYVRAAAAVSESVYAYTELLWW